MYYKYTRIDHIAIVSFNSPTDLFAGCSLIACLSLKNFERFTFLSFQFKATYNVWCIRMYYTLCSSLSIPGNDRWNEHVSFSKRSAKAGLIIDRLLCSFRNSTISSKHFGEIGAFSKALKGVTSINLSIAPNSKSFYSIKTYEKVWYIGHRSRYRWVAKNLFWGI